MSKSKIENYKAPRAPKADPYQGIGWAGQADEGNLDWTEVDSEVMAFAVGEVTWHGDCLMFYRHRDGMYLGVTILRDKGKIRQTFGTAASAESYLQHVGEALRANRLLKARREALAASIESESTITLAELEMERQEALERLSEDEREAVGKGA